MFSQFNRKILGIVDSHHRAKNKIHEKAGQMLLK
jgi:hypothetical protein